MLAYVFWHCPAAGVDADQYERALAEFHRALAEAPPDGFARSFCHHFERLPWLGEGGPGYEDWYLAEGWTAVGMLETGAVSGSRRGPHDRAAFASAKGAGAVYGFAAGSVDGLASGSRAWFGRPEETAYHELDGLLTPALAGGDAGLWRRRLVLGPAPEHCLAGAPAAELPADVDAFEAGGRLIFSPSGPFG
ncbi:MAG TPA: hypothetical protein VFY99_05430 [Solirubrobacterales bacterium]